jgi:Ca2+-binding EF-hand superfamily protein
MIRTTLATALILAGGLAYAQAQPQPQDGGADREARRAEMKAQAQARFAAADANGDGRLDRAEAQTLGERVAANFDRIDANADGQIDPQEIAKARHHARHRGGERAAFHRGLMRGMDDDGDGSISRVELGNKVPKLVQEFTAIDGNGDGELSPEEMRAHRGQRKGAHGSQAPE